MAINWRIEDDCSTLGSKLKVNYVGPNPFRICLRASDILLRFFEVEKKDVWERDFRWDISSDPNKFHVRFFVQKKIDDKSEIFAEIVMEGVQPSDPTKNGNVSILISGKVITNYPLNTAFKRLPVYRGIIWFYHFVFYDSVRKGYLNMCKIFLDDLTKEFKKILGIAE